VLDRQAALKADWADSFYHAAVCYAAIGRIEQATERVQAALDINPHYKAAAALACRLPHLKRKAA
jgi:tetratricopeptide (TPR) repeat protein